jgi:hypothetical protein
MATAQQTQATALPGSLFGVPGGTLPIEEPDTTQSLSTVPVPGIADTGQRDLPVQADRCRARLGACRELHRDGDSRHRPDDHRLAVLPVHTVRAHEAELPEPVQRDRRCADEGPRVLPLLPAALVPERLPERQLRGACRPAQTAGFPVSTWNQANLNLTSNMTLTGSVNVNFAIRFPASIELDHYYPLDISGNMVGAPGRAILSPQYMGGTTRIIVPSLTLNASPRHARHLTVLHHGTDTDDRHRLDHHGRDGLDHDPALRVLLEQRRARASPGPAVAVRPQVVPVPVANQSGRSTSHFRTTTARSSPSGFGSGTRRSTRAPAAAWSSARTSRTVVCSTARA